MKVIIINGSPSLKKGMTHQLIKHFTIGCESAGAEVEQIDLSRMKLKFCTACLHCLYSKDHLCIHKDGMAEVHEKILAADYMVLATPVFADGVSGHMKVFMDRFVTMLDVRFEMVDGRYRHVRRFEKLPKVALLSVAGFYEMENFDVVNLHAKNLAGHIRSPYVGALLRPCSYLLGMDKLLPAEVLDVKNAIEEAGAELVTDGKFKAETLERVQHNPMDPETYLIGANHVHEKCLAAGKFLYFQK